MIVIHKIKYAVLLICFSSLQAGEQIISEVYTNCKLDEVVEQEFYDDIEIESYLKGNLLYSSSKEQEGEGNSLKVSMRKFNDNEIGPFHAFPIIELLCKVEGDWFLVQWTIYPDTEEFSFCGILTTDSSEQKFYLSSPQEWKKGTLVFSGNAREQFQAQLKKYKGLSQQALEAKKEDFPKDTKFSDVIEKFGAPHLISRTFGSEKSTLAMYHVIHGMGVEMESSHAFFMFTNEELVRVETKRESAKKK